MLKGLGTGLLLLHTLRKLILGIQMIACSCESVVEGDGVGHSSSTQIGTRVFGKFVGYVCTYELGIGVRILSMLHMLHMIYLFKQDGSAPRQCIPHDLCVRVLSHIPDLDGVLRSSNSHIARLCAG